MQNINTSGTKTIYVSYGTIMLFDKIIVFSYDLLQLKSKKRTFVHKI